MSGELKQFLIHESYKIKNKQVNTVNSEFGLFTSE